MNIFDLNNEWSFVTFCSEISNDDTSFDISMIYPLGKGGIETTGVGCLFLSTSLKEEGLEDEDVPFPITSLCRCKTRKRVESLHMLLFDLFSCR